MPTRSSTDLVSRSRLLVLCAALATLPSAAAPGPSAAPHPTWIDPADLALQQVLPPPPALDSPAERADLAAVQAAVAARGPEDERRIRADVARGYDRFAEVLGPGYDPARVPKLARLIEQVFQDGELAVQSAKAAFARRRPYALDPSLHVLGTPSGHPAYPSGHTTFAYLAAIVLSEAVPERREALFVRAAEYAYNRTQAGVHFLTDLEGGKIAAAVIGAALLRDPGFRNALAEAADEARRAVGKGP